MRSADRNAAGFNKTMHDEEGDPFPWVAVPMGSDDGSRLRSIIPNSTLPHCGVINAQTGAVLV